MIVVTKVVEEKSVISQQKTDFVALTCCPQGVRASLLLTYCFNEQKHWHGANAWLAPSSRRLLLPRPPPLSPGKPQAAASRPIESLETRSCGFVQHQESDTHTHADLHTLATPPISHRWVITWPPSCCEASMSVESLLCHYSQVHFSFPFSFLSTLAWTFFCPNVLFFFVFDQRIALLLSRFGLYDGISGLIWVQQLVCKVEAEQSCFVWLCNKAILLKM